MEVALDGYGDIHGEKPYEQRARQALPILVRQAKAGVPISYENLAAELDMPFALNLNYPLACIGTALRNLAQKWGGDIPHLPTLVVRKGDGAPGSGIDTVLKNLGKRWENAKERRAVVHAYFSEITTYPYWDEVLIELGLQSAPSSINPILEKASGPGGGEGPEHKAMKALVLANPHLAGLREVGVNGAMEHYLPSGDSIDVYFTSAEMIYAVEVKPAGAPEHDIARGLFQCVKYLAVMQALAAFENENRQIIAVLALGGKLPAKLIPLRNSLGLQVFEQLMH